jgi:spermidine/putrescine transport system substrate-binding protein
LSLSRRTFLRGMTGALLAPGLSACVQGSRRQDGIGDTVNIYSWADYLHPDTIPQFEKRTGIQVVYDTFASNEALLAKLQAGASDYDIVVPTGYMMHQLVKLNLLQELDHAKIPNLKNIMPRFQHAAHDPGLKYSVPYTWGTTGIGYNTTAMRSAMTITDADMALPQAVLDKTPGDWDVFWDDRMSNRITLLEDPREVIGMALKRRGHSFNTRDDALIRKATDDLKEQKPLTMCYSSDQVITQLVSGDCWLALVYSGDAYQAMRQNTDVRYAIPVSGCSIWLDSLCIPKTAPHPQRAYEWINYILEPAVGAAIANYTRYATPNLLALPLVQEELKNDKILYPNESVLARCEEIGDVGKAIFTYDRMWTELKCS